MTIFIILGLLAFLAWVYYMITQRIDEQKIAEWEEYKRNRPDLFANPDDKNIVVNVSNGKKKYVTEMWARYRASHTQWQSECEPKSDIRKEHKT
jgi:hypothetical protein